MIMRGLLWLLFSLLLLAGFLCWLGWLVMVDGLCALVNRAFDWLYQDIGL